MGEPQALWASGAQRREIGTSPSLLRSPSSADAQTGRTSGFSSPSSSAPRPPLFATTSTPTATPTPLVSYHRARNKLTSSRDHQGRDAGPSSPLLLVNPLLAAVARYSMKLKQFRLSTNQDECCAY